MKTLALLMLAILVATTSLADSRKWQTGKVDVTTETRVSSKLGGAKTTIHYSIETSDTIYSAEYSFKPGPQDDNGAPKILLGEQSKIAIEGKHAYVLDVTGKEVKLHIVQKSKR